MPDNNGRVTTREFYDALIKQNERMEDMERRILKKIDDLPTKCPYASEIETNKAEIGTLRKRVNIIGGVNGTLAAAAAFVGSIFGKAP